MQIDIKTQAVTQLRQTFSHVARHLGSDKPASRYQEATYGLQAETNFHYRPLWQPDLELYDQRRTRLVMKDWYALRDPRQFYYGTYTITRARQQETLERNLDFVDKRGLLRELPATARDTLLLALIPLRHLEWGANTHNCYVTAYGWGTALTQATMFHTMDRLGLAQILSRIGLLLDGNSGESLTRAKQLWLDHPAWQGLRRVTEQLLVTPDCMEVFVAQNLVLDGLLYPLVYQHFERRFSAAHGPALSLLTDFMTQWFDETSRWIDAVTKTCVAESAANQGLVTDWVLTWGGSVREALAVYAAAVLDSEADAAMTAVSDGFAARIAKLGVKPA